MNHYHLREIAKVGTGLVLADIVSVFWFSAVGLLPMSILGVTWTTSMLPEIVIFDLALLLLLVHYGWKMKLPISSPSERTLLNATGIIFLIVALVHFIRITFGLQIFLGTFMIPFWFSWIGIIITGYLSYASFHFANMRRR